MSHLIDEDTLIEDEMYRTLHNPRPITRSISHKLRARIETLARYRVDPAWIIFPEDTVELHGGAATVSKARMGRPEMQYIDVAVKRMRIYEDTDIERALGLAIREFEFYAELSHPNIISVEGFVEDISNPIVWLVFPWADYGNLRDFVASLDWEISERISLIGDVANGVAYLHSRTPPICHGDLKSLNVVVDENCYARITDFASARRVSQSSMTVDSQPHSPSAQQVTASSFASNRTITLTGNRYSLRWAAPELLLEDQLSLWSDIWALGWVAYEVMTESLPFQDAASEIGVVERVIGGSLPSLADNPNLSSIGELVSLISLCWNVTPTERPTASLFQKGIEDMVPPSEAGTFEMSGKTLTLSRLTMLGRLHQSRGDYARASEYLVEALRRSREGENGEQLLPRLRAVAHLHRLRKEYDMAIAFYNEILEICTTLGDKRGRADTFWALADVHRLRDEHSDAIRSYSEALQIRTDLDDKKGRADAFWALAEVHRLQDEHSDAIRFYSEALKIRTNLGDRRGRGDALWALADMHRLQGEHFEAIRFYSKALRVRTDFGDRRGRAEALWALAGVHRLQQEYTEAISLYSKALKIRTDLNDRRGRAKALLGLADVYRDRGEWEEATRFYSEALEIHTALGDNKGRVDALLGLAGVKGNRREDDGEAAPL